MHFCDKCFSQFNITKNVEAKMIGGYIHGKLNNIFNKFFNNESLDETDLDGITIDDIVNDDRHTYMTAKDKARLRTSIRTVDRKFVNEIKGGDDAGDAFFICRLCSNYKHIEPRTRIFSQAYKAQVSNSSISNLESNDNTLSRTKAYICPNDKCPTIKDPSLREAVLTKDRAGHIIYICTKCNTNWSQGV